MLYLAIVGGSSCDESVASLAEDTGAEVARRGGVVVCGGRGGVMEAASRGARSTGGMVLGILPGDDPRQGNPYLTLAVATGLGEARNAVITRTADAVIAIGGEYGTLSEIALALKMGKPVIGLRTWQVNPPGERKPDREIVEAETPAAAVEAAWTLAERQFSG